MYSKKMFHDEQKYKTGFVIYIYQNYLILDCEWSVKFDFLIYIFYFVCLPLDIF